VSGSRIRNRRFCPVCNKPLESHEIVRGYEIEKGRYVRVTDAELDELEAESNSSIDLREFIPIEKIDARGGCMTCGGKVSVRFRYGFGFT